MPSLSPCGVSVAQCRRCSSHHLRHPLPEPQLRLMQRAQQEGSHDAGCTQAAHAAQRCMQALLG